MCLDNMQCLLQGNYEAVVLTVHVQIGVVREATELWKTESSRRTARPAHRQYGLWCCVFSVGLRLSLVRIGLWLCLFKCCGWRCPLAIMLLERWGILEFSCRPSGWERRCPLAKTLSSALWSFLEYPRCQDHGWLFLVVGTGGSSRCRGLFTFMSILENDHRFWRRCHCFLHGALGVG